MFLATHTNEAKSPISCSEGLRFEFPIIQFYRRNPSVGGKDPVEVIREAIAKALVYYYPFAGRLRERAARKLAVECTGEGVMFVEADADVSLLQLGGDTLYPPFPYLDKLLSDVQGSAGVVDCPVPGQAALRWTSCSPMFKTHFILIQVTRLTCGGFVFAIRFNHAMSDGTGMFQLMSAIGELARGAEAPSVEPIWQRHLLTARHPPHVPFAHPEYDALSPEPEADVGVTVQRSFFFSSARISALRRTLPPHLQGCSEFDVVAGCTWRCRTIALSLNPDEEIRFSCVVDFRKRMNPPLPPGYYGNAIALPAAVTTAGELSRKPLQYAVELVRKAKYEATDEYVRSVADLMVMRWRPSFTAARTYLVSNMKRAGFEQVDFGWGAAEYGGVAKSIRSQIHWYVPLKNKMGTVVPVSLPIDSMEVFVKQLQLMMTAAPRTSCL